MMWFLLLYRLGQGKETEGLRRACALHRCLQMYILDVIDEFAGRVHRSCVQANAIYENKYLLGTSMARPPSPRSWWKSPARRVLAPSATALPAKETTRYVSSWASRHWLHDLKIIAPGAATRHGKMQSREDEIEYCHQHRHSSSVLRRFQLQP